MKKFNLVHIQLTSSQNILVDYSYMVQRDQIKYYIPKLINPWNSVTISV
jgi:hypothetical protein